MHHCLPLKNVIQKVNFIILFPGLRLHHVVYAILKQMKGGKEFSDGIKMLISFDSKLDSHNGISKNATR